MLPIVYKDIEYVTWDALAAKVHENNERWWRDPHTGERIERNKGEMLMLEVSELAECLEGHRKSLMDDHIPWLKSIDVEMADVLIRHLDYAAGHGYMIESDPYHDLIWTGNFGEDLLQIVGLITLLYNYSTDNGSGSIYDQNEVVNSIIAAICGFCASHSIDLNAAFDAKMLYNETRMDHTLEARRLADGKKY